MKIKFPKYFQKEINANFGIRPSHVVKVVQNPEQYQQITLHGDYEIHFIRNYIGGAKNPHYLLLHGHVEANSFIVELVWRIYPGLHPDIKSLNPLQTLHELTRQYGLPVTIAAVTNHIIYDSTIPLMQDTDTNIVSINNPEKSRCLQNMAFRIVEEDGKRVARCGLIYCIDTDKYQKWILKQEKSDHMGIEKEGSITFWCNHEHEDWPTNESSYDFGKASGHGVSVRAVKHPDKTIEIIADGPLFERFQYRCRIPPCDDKGLFVALTWNKEVVTLYLNGKPADEIESLGPGAMA